MLACILRKGSNVFTVKKAYTGYFSQRMALNIVHLAKQSPTPGATQNIEGATFAQTRSNSTS
jgi:hypothetical protein